MPRFALLLHDHPFIHWDFFLEAEGSLLSWRLSRRPVPEQDIHTERLPPHRSLYLDYEGPVSNNRGNVSREDAGEFEWIRPDESMIVRGEWLIGEVTIRAVESGFSFRWTNHGLPAPFTAPLNTDSVERPTTTSS